MYETQNKDQRFQNLTDLSRHFQTTIDIVKEIKASTKNANKTITVQSEEKHRFLEMVES